ncbi:MAG: SurA N-terminal domain-containing protein [Nitrospirae bacterium YQR-1]
MLKLPAYTLFAVIFFLLITTLSFAQEVLLDSVAAFVDDTAITYSEFEKKYDETSSAPAIKASALNKKDVINTMINRVLLKKMALAMKLTGKDDDDLISQFIEIKIRSYVIIREEEIERFCKEHNVKAESDDERKEVEKYLTEAEINKRLKTLIEELRAKAYIKVYIEK